MRSLPDDARLLILVLLNALVLVAAIRFIRRRHRNSDFPKAVTDVMLIWYLVQYLSITLPGLIGVLNVWSMMLTAIALSVAMIAAPKSRKAQSESTTDQITRLDRRIVLACLAVLISLMAGQIYNVRYAPPNANDALTYHLPAAVTWLQTGRIGLFETWFFNPANTYSPLAGSTFIAWLIAPMQSDILARAVQVPAIVLIFYTILQLARTLGANIRLAAIIALAACCARPMIHQVFLAKDDLFVTAFFAVSVLAMTNARIRDPLGAIRLGIALGLLIATKYTALLCLPVLLLMIDRRDARRYVIALVVALLIAGPWYLRNLILTGNPLYPIDLPLLHGMFSTARSESLRTTDGIWKSFTNYSGLTRVPLLFLLAIWIAGTALAAKRVARDPLLRTIVIGPPLMILLFIATSPYAEVRFVYPAIALMFVATAIVIVSVRSHEILKTLSAIVLVGLMIGTSAIPRSLELMRDPALCALLVSAIVVIAIEIRSLAMWAFMLFGVAALTYVYWQPYSNQYRDEATRYWQLSYGPLAQAWQFARNEVPADATIAYANTHFVHPLYGADLGRHVVYAQVRANVQRIDALGHIDGAIPGERIVDRVRELTVRDSDRDTWIRNLRDRNVTHLFVAKPQADQVVPELEFAQENAGFRRVFDNAAAVIYEVDVGSQ